MHKTTTAPGGSPAAPGAPRRTLFAISDDLLALEDLLLETGGDVSEEEAERIVDTWLEQLGAERDEKLDSYAALIKEMEARAGARRDMARQITERARADEATAKRLKDRLAFFFARCGWKTIETLRFRLTRAKAGGKAPLVVTVTTTGELEALPERFKQTHLTITLRHDAPDAHRAHVVALLGLGLAPGVSMGHKIEVDEVAVRAALDAGETLLGSDGRPFARYGERSEYIRIS